ncbi:MAG: SipW-dependent-type signal peptide-containing protein [Halanaeroarchaeum sp.]
MTDDDKLFDLTRRKVLGSLGALGAGAALGGAGTAAFFSDEETFTGNELVAGSLDLKVDWQQTYTGADGLVPVTAYPDHDDGLQSVVRAINDDQRVVEYELHGEDSRQPITLYCDELESGDRLPDDVYANDRRPEQTHLVELTDVKPGDSGEITFSLHLCDNPGYVWLTGDLTENAENGVVSGEVGDNTPEVGELADALQARVWYDDCDGAFGDEPVIAEGSLASVLESVDGYRLSPTGAGACLESDKLEDGGNPDLLTLEDEVYEFSYDDTTVPVRLTNFQFKENGTELIAFDFAVQDPDYGVCSVAVKASTQTEVASFECAQSGTVRSIERPPDTEGYYGISHVTFSLCERGDDDCFEACTDHCVGFEGWLPEDAPLDAQTDSVAFDLGFVAEQCRHNGGESP